MVWYAGIDLHSTNSVVVVLDERDKVVRRARLTNHLETGDIDRFDDVGHYVSYGRLVGSSYLSNGKRKGSGNTKNGNAFVCWAYIEAANFAIRFDRTIRRFYDRKKSRTKRIVALKAVAHKLARACYHMIKDDTEFKVTRAFL
ncbi:MAG: transposase [Planctomycetes bacterium]|nr:transposase [Planctomycetota bacterium]